MENPKQTAACKSYMKLCKIRHGLELLAEPNTIYINVYFSFLSMVYVDPNAAFKYQLIKRNTVSVIIILTPPVNIQSDGQEGYKQTSAFFHTS